MDKDKCCGCGTCVLVCPRHCIAMKEDEEGFYYPYVQKDKCVSCGLCLKRCPYTRAFSNKILDVFVARNQDRVLLKKSSSGGVFIEIARFVIKNGGVVFGAVYDSLWNVVHVMAESMEDVYPMMGSKYVQSNIGDCFIKAKSELDNHRLVLFTGTPCQIAGLNSFLSKTYDNLIAIDILCHGVPSPLIWKKYFSEIASDISKITQINMRDKSWGWGCSRFVIQTCKNKVVDEIGYKNYYRHGYTAHLYTRPSCYNCNMVKKSGSDLTIGDCWGICHSADSLNDDKGASIIIAHTVKVKEILSNTSLYIKRIPYDMGKINNGGFEHEIEIPDLREKFWQKLKETHSVYIALDDIFHESRFHRYYNDKIWKIKKLIRNML